MRPSKFTLDQIFQILAESKTPGISIAEICRKYGISRSSFDKWRKKYDGMSSDEAKRLKAIESENSILKKIVAEQSMELALLRDIIKKNSL